MFFVYCSEVSAAADGGCLMNYLQAQKKHFVIACIRQQIAIYDTKREIIRRVKAHDVIYQIPLVHSARLILSKCSLMREEKRVAVKAHGNRRND